MLTTHPFPVIVGNVDHPLVIAFMFLSLFGNQRLQVAGNHHLAVSMAKHITSPPRRTLAFQSLIRKLRPHVPCSFTKPMLSLHFLLSFKVIGSRHSQCNPAPHRRGFVIKEARRRREVHFPPLNCKEVLPLHTSAQMYAEGTGLGRAMKRREMPIT